LGEQDAGKAWVKSRPVERVERPEQSREKNSDRAIVGAKPYKRKPKKKEKTRKNRPTREGERPDVFVG